MFEIKPHRIKSAAMEEVRIAGAVRSCAARTEQVLAAMNKGSGTDMILAGKLKEIQGQITGMGARLEKYGQAAAAVSRKYENTERTAVSYQVSREYGNVTYQSIDLREVTDRIRQLGQIRI